MIWCKRLQRYGGHKPLYLIGLVQIHKYQGGQSRAHRHDTYKISRRAEGLCVYDGIPFENAGCLVSTSLFNESWSHKKLTKCFQVDGGENDLTVGGDLEVEIIEEKKKRKQGGSNEKKGGRVGGQPKHTEDIQNLSRR